MAMVSARLVLQNVIVNQAMKDQPAPKALVVLSSKTRHALAGESASTAAAFVNLDILV